MKAFVSVRNNTMLALDTIVAHKLRTLLTILGVIIGTGTIIGVGAILTGFDGAITNVLSSF
jgi:putative ABC transport system permease protein